MKVEIRDLVVEFEGDPLGLLAHLGGCYIRPPEGPLVGYAGEYEDGEGQKKHYVGEIYANFAVAEGWPTAVKSWAKDLGDRNPSLEVDVFLGAPEGGKSFADKLANVWGCQYLYPNVKETPVEGKDRPKKEFYWGRHQLEPGQRVVITEDVANNFSTTQKLLQLVVDAECTPVALACILNRSPKVDMFYEWENEQFPVLSCVRKPMPEFRQDDPEVVDDIAAGNIVWKPRATKETWQGLMDAMEKDSSS